MKKCLVHIEESVTPGGLYRPTHLCVAHLNCTKKFTQFFLWCGKVGGCLERGEGRGERGRGRGRGRGGGGGGVHVSGGRGLHGV